MRNLILDRVAKYEMPNHVDEVPISAVARPWKLLAVHHNGGTSSAPHAHATGQLLFATKGVMLVDTELTTWLVPPQRGLWIPPGEIHTLRILSDADLRTIYCSQVLLDACPSFIRSNVIHVIEATALIREVIGKIFESEDPLTQHLAIPFLLHVLGETQVLSTDIPMPAMGRLRVVAHEILNRDGWNVPLARLADLAAMSERTLTRRFQQDTGVSLRSWRQRARICASLNLLASGKSVKQCAAELGFSGSGAFIAAFRNVLGRTPSEFVLS